jgi:hypothetical protein
MIQSISASGSCWIPIFNFVCLLNAKQYMQVYADGRSSVTLSKTLRKQHRGVELRESTLPIGYHILRLCDEYNESMRASACVFNTVYVCKYARVLGIGGFESVSTVVCDADEPSMKRFTYFQQICNACVLQLHNAFIAPLDDWRATNFYVSAGSFICMHKAIARYIGHCFFVTFCTLEVWWSRTNIFRILCHFLQVCMNPRNLLLLYIWQDIRQW